MVYVAYSCPSILEASSDSAWMMSEATADAVSLIACRIRRQILSGCRLSLDWSVGSRVVSVIHVNTPLLPPLWDFPSAFHLRWWLSLLAAHWNHLKNFKKISSEFWPLSKVFPVYFENDQVSPASIIVINYVFRCSDIDCPCIPEINSLWFMVCFLKCAAYFVG